MIAMTDFGRNGRFGNQLFQYAFMRSQAEASGLKLFLPRWVGDSVFDLDDGHLRCGPPSESLSRFREPHNSCGYNPITLPDGVDVTGFFQSERMFDRRLIRRAYSFRDPILPNARALLGNDFDPSNDLAVGVRLRDFLTTLTHYCPRPLYFSRALRSFHAERIFLFSDDAPRAVQILRSAGFQGEILPIEATPILSLAAMSCFHNFIIGPSTFHWWGAWLSPSLNKRVVAPQEGATRPGAPVRARDFWPQDWETLPALRKIDSYRMRTTSHTAAWRLKRLLRRPD